MVGFCSTHVEARMVQHGAAMRRAKNLQISVDPTEMRKVSQGCPIYSSGWWFFALPLWIIWLNIWIIYG